MKFTLRALKRDELSLLYPLVRQLNPTLKKPLFLARLEAMLPLGYQAVGAFHKGTLVGASGFWLRTRFWCGKEMDIDNFVVDVMHRNSGVGALLLAWLEKKAKAERCDIIVLDVYSSNMLAHRFYHAHGFTLTGYHMTKRPGSRIPWSKSEASCAS